MLHGPVKEFGRRWKTDYFEWAATAHKMENRDRQFTDWAVAIHGPSSLGQWILPRKIAPELQAPASAPGLWYLESTGDRKLTFERAQTGNSMLTAPFEEAKLLNNKELSMTAIKLWNIDELQTFGYFVWERQESNIITF